MLANGLVLSKATQRVVDQVKEFVDPNLTKHVSLPAETLAWVKPVCYHKDVFYECALELKKLDAEARYFHISSVTEAIG